MGAAKGGKELKPFSYSGPIKGLIPSIQLQMAQEKEIKQKEKPIGKSA
jgi:hypothetical protein